MGPAILTALVDAGFEVTVLTRKTSNPSVPSSVTVKPVDYESLDSLTSALQGQDAIVSTLGGAAIPSQVLLVEAAAKAGIKRFIPSEFGGDTTNEKSKVLPIFAPKAAVQNVLEKQSSVTYTQIMTGPFLDWGLMTGFVVNVKGKSVNLYDGGERTFSTTSLPTIGKAVVGVLRNLEATKNRAVYVQDTATTMKDLVAKAKNATGSDGWKEEVVPLDGVLDKGWAELKKGNPNPQSYIYNFIFAAIWGEGYGSHFQKLDNELLGIKEMSEEEVQSLVSSYA